MSACGNPIVETDALMPRKAKFDKLRKCIKCKEVNGNIVIRHAVYCKMCFFPLVTAKFKRRLDPHINEDKSDARRSKLIASGNLVIGLSGGLGSTVLLDLVYQSYFRHKGEAKGGKSHPRNDRVWKKAFVCYVEICGAFQEGKLKDRTEDVRTIAEQRGFEFVPLRIEQAFDEEWWKSCSGSPHIDDIRTSLTDEGLQISKISSQSLNNPKDTLRMYLNSLPTPSAVRTSISNLIRLLLAYTARHLDSSHLVLGASLTSLSISLITSIAQGGGYNVQEESYEELPLPNFTTANEDNIRGKMRNLRIVRPLQDIGMKECAAYAWWSNLKVAGKEPIPDIPGKSTIGGLTRDFIIGLECDYPSTVSTIARTCAKVVPKFEADGRCELCNRPYKQGVLEWKAKISIRTLQKEHMPSNEINNNSSGSLAPHLCYACHTTLTSRSSRAVRPAGKDPDNTSNGTPLPVWTRATIMTKNENEIMRVRPLDRHEIKSAISDFLIED